MKTLICISGHLRKYENYIEKFRNQILNPISKISQYDIIISTWHKRNTDKCLSVRVDWKRAYSGLEDNIVNLESLYDYLNPLTIEIENQHQFSLDYSHKMQMNHRAATKFGDGKAFWWMYMFYKIWRCSQLVDFNKYDYAVRCRIDAFPKKEIEWNDLFDENIHIPFLEINGQPFAFDMFWMGPIHQMYETFQFYLHYEKVIDLCYSPIPEIAFHTWLMTLKDKISIKEGTLPEFSKEF
ncbi:MAG: hypothetical protein HC836_42260 [Richelia sp. RM2_1_2]|nr:hypothetical protein [Richelia sp. RM2_1_2]